jgi:hypothetical protein
MIDEHSNVIFCMYSQSSFKIQGILKPQHAGGTAILSNQEYQLLETKSFLYDIECGDWNTLEKNLY